MARTQLLSKKDKDPSTLVFSGPVVIALVIKWSQFLMVLNWSWGGRAEFGTDRFRNG